MAKKILIVDDEPDFLTIFTKVLGHAGYTVGSAIKGKDAIDAYVQSLNNNDPFSLILLDVKMPDINGLEVLKVIRKEEQSRGIPDGAGVPIIVFTGYEDPQIDASFKRGRNDYMIKSRNNAELLKIIEDKLK